MEIWLWALLGIMAVFILALLIKIHLLQKAAREIETAFADRLITDTNTLIDISTGDKYMRGLANAVNIQLRKLREERRRFRQGDTELKNAVTNISHDLRTPLTAVCGYLDLLEQEDKSETVTRYLEIIRNRAEILTQLTEELFRYSVILSGDKNAAKESVAIDSILEESIAAFYTAIHERGIVPDIKMPQSKVIRTLDPSALARVFSNLLSNAVKYSDGDLELTLSEKGEITFTNTASELNEVQVGKLFDRFFTVEAARSSTGLGLAIARTLVEQMNGSITARYENSRLSICIVLPDTRAES
ncbi:MAG: HAMP domain-containing histidine kinase [Butyrivibrio sp.]|nr:HAMP domain-containing histidine kinase [Acetatifactor muris]MCM1560844.1 HAMP domain-containing histidine kinase [Butyrivibrio sp.]